MPLKQILMFDINRVLKWDVGRALRSDVMKWRIPAVLVRGITGWLVGGLVLGLLVPFAARRGWQLPDALHIAAIVAFVLVFALSWQRRQ